MHDEDSKKGLWVKNPQNKEWKSFGDKRLFESDDKETVRLLGLAQQQSVTEIWDAHHHQPGYQIPEPSAYGAWQYAPIVDSAFSDKNFPPMFLRDGDGVQLRSDNQHWWFPKEASDKTYGKPATFVLDASLQSVKSATADTLI